MNIGPSCEPMYINSWRSTTLWRWLPIVCDGKNKQDIPFLALTTSLSNYIQCTYSPLQKPWKPSNNFITLHFISFYCKTPLPRTTRFRSNTAERCSCMSGAMVFGNNPIIGVFLTFFISTLATLFRPSLCLQRFVCEWPLSLWKKEKS